jgi:hypothetical protein
MMSEAEERERFEKWVSSPPYEKYINRYPDEDTFHAWPGQYMNSGIQLAWEAWQQALEVGNE